MIGAMTLTNDRTGADAKTYEGRVKVKMEDQ